MRGSKADNLETLRSIGMQVPEFYVIEHEFLLQIHDNNVQEKLISDYRTWCDKYKVHETAVRSSADSEDSVDQSFAGQFTSVMKIHTNHDFLEALKTVHASRPKAGYGQKTSHTVNVIVQRYIEPDSAGVLFTVNPSNGLPEMLINAVRGHGGKAVDGQDVQSYFVDRISGDARVKGTFDQAVLTEQHIASITKAGIKIEHSMGSPQDIEWAIRGDTLYLLQARPITKINYLKVWDNANIGESFPGIVMPLTFSIARRGYELVYKSQALEGGMSWYDLEAHHRTFHDMVGLFGGRMYYNLGSWYAFIGLFPSNHRNQKFLDDQLLTVGDVVYLPPSTYPLKQKLRFYMRAARRTAFFELEKRRYWRKLNAAIEHYGTLPNGTSLPILLSRYTYVEQMIVPHMGRSADNDFFVMTYHGILKQKLRKWLGDQEGQSLNFLGTLHDVISARQAELLAEIANSINEDETASRYIAHNHFERLDAYLLTTDTGALLAEYRHTFLHRFAGDQKIESVNPLLSLSGFYGLIKTYCQLDHQALTRQRAAALEAERQRHEQIVSQLGFGRSLIYKLLVNRLKHHLRIREHNRLLRGKVYALLRDLFPSVGEGLMAHGIIAHAADVYFLDIEEILRYTDGTGYGDDAKRIVSERKKRYESYKAINPPSRFITTGLAYELPTEALSQAESPAGTATSLPGTISSPGDVTGKVIVLREPQIPKEPFDILVVSHTDPGWTPLIALAKGVIVEHGGILSHAAIVTRELGIPSMIGVENATQLLRTGMTVRINTAKSTVDVVE